MVCWSAARCATATATPTGRACAQSLRATWRCSPGHFLTCVQEGDKICETCHSKTYRGGAAHRSGVRGPSRRPRRASRPRRRSRAPKPFELLKGDKTKRQRIDGAMDKILADLEKNINAVLQPGEGRFSVSSLTLTIRVAGVVEVTVVPAAPAASADPSTRTRRRTTRTATRTACRSSACPRR